MKKKIPVLIISFIILMILLLALAGSSNDKKKTTKSQSQYNTTNLAPASYTPTPTQFDTIYVYATPTPIGYDAYSYTEQPTADGYAYNEGFTEDASPTHPEADFSEYLPTDTPTPAQAQVYMGTSELKVSFINVGQGDCTLIQDNGSAMLIDTGPKEAVGSIEAILNDNGLSTIDTMVLTHPDADHIQGAINLIRDYDVKAIYMPNYAKMTGTYSYLMDTINKYQVPVIYPENGSYIPFGTASYQILGPILDAIPYYEEERDLANFYSIVIKVTNGADTFLFTGDAPGAETDAILKAGFDVSAKVLKASHHGSANEGCNNEALWNAVSPDAVVISCGLYNDHGHPHEEVMDMIQKRGCKLFRTDLQGTFYCISTGSGISWSTAPSQDYRYGRAMY